MLHMARDSKLVTKSPFWAGIRLMRPWNVMMIAAAMALITHSLVLPNSNVPDEYRDTLLILGIISMTSLAAGANIINDYFDITEDRINRPNKALVGRVISRRQTMALNYLFIAIAIGSTASISAMLGNYVHVIWILTVGVLLWGYSPFFKRRFLRGNLIIAFSVGQLPFWCLLLFQPMTSWVDWLDTERGWILLSYGVLSAWVTFLREITKDLQDLNGDTAAGYDTLPVRWGTNKSMKFLKLLHGAGWIVMAMAWMESIQQLSRPIAPLFFILPYLAATIQLWRGQVASVSAWQKMTLAGGLIYLIGMLG